MAEEIDPRGGEIEVTPEEERFLKRFFRRQALPYFVLVLVISVTAAAWPRGGDQSALEARTAAALAQLRTEKARLEAELAALSERVEAGLSGQDRGANELERRVEEAKRNVRMIEARVTAALEERLDALETKLASDLPPAARLAPSGPPPEAAAWDVSAILDRLYALEMRQERGDSTQEADGRSRARRLVQLEARIERLEQELPALPAAPAAP